MHKREKKKILAVVDDLLFTVKISDAAKRVGLDVEFLKSAKDVVDKANQENPLLIWIAVVACGRWIGFTMLRLSF